MYRYGQVSLRSQALESLESGDTADAVDLKPPAFLANYADAAIRAGDVDIALEAAEIGLTFDPKQTWIKMNRAHALMFLGRTQDARERVCGNTRGVPWSNEGDGRFFVSSKTRVADGPRPRRS